MKIYNTTIKDHEIQIRANNLTTNNSNTAINPNQKGISGVFIPTNQVVINQTTTGKDINNMNNLNNPGYPVNNITTALPKNN
jgi:hypothetical protein